MKNFLVLTLMGLLLLAVKVYEPKPQTLDQSQLVTATIDQDIQTPVVSYEMTGVEPVWIVQNFTPGVQAAGVFVFTDAQSDAESAVENNDTGQSDRTALDLMKSNWAVLLLALLGFIKVIVRITPTLKDDAVFGRIDNLLNAIIPNFQTKKIKESNE